MRPIIYFTITAIFWGLNFHFAKVLLKEASFLESGFWRYLFGVIPLFLLAVNELPSLDKIRQYIKGIALVGIVCLFGFNLFFFLGLMKSPAINAALIIAVTPALTLLFSRAILNTPLERGHLIGVALSFFGVLFLIVKGNFGNFSAIQFNRGDILLVISSIFFALQNVWVKKYAGNISNKNFTLLTNALCLTCFAVILPFTGMGNVASYSLSFWGAAVGIGFFGTAVAYYLWNAGIQLTSANQAGIFINVVPLSTAVFSVFFGEMLFSYHLISGLFILLGVFVMRR